MNYDDLGHRLKVERTKLNYKQEYIAEKIGVGQRYISKIEHGRAKPEFAKVFELANLLGISLDYLTGGEADKDDDYLTNTINIRLQLLSSDEKAILLEAVEYYINHVKNKRAVNK